MVQTFANPEWGSLDWGSQQGKIVHDISPTFSTVTGLDALVRRYRGVVNKKENEGGKPKWSEIVWAGTGDKIVSRTGQSLDAALKRIRSVNTGFSTQSKLDGQIIIRKASAYFNTTSELAVLLRGALRSLIDFNGTLAPGDELVIKTEKMIIEKNLTNARPDAIIPEWPELEPGANSFVYTDLGTNGTIEIELAKEDRTL